MFDAQESRKDADKDGESSEREKGNISGLRPVKCYSHDVYDKREIDRQSMHLQDSSVVTEESDTVKVAPCLSHFVVSAGVGRDWCTARRVRQSKSRLPLLQL
jgi:hypothetical protein